MMINTPENGIYMITLIQYDDFIKGGHICVSYSTGSGNEKQLQSQSP